MKPGLAWSALARHGPEGDTGPDVGAKEGAPRKPAFTWRSFATIGSMRGFVVWALTLFSAAACIKKNPDYCATDGDCTDVTRPFCDVTGEFEESGFEDNTCTIRPADCALERCGCTAGESLRCEASTSTVCNADGRSVAEVPCALGCSSNDACLTFEPSNGLGPALESAASEDDVTFLAGTIIDSDTGSATASGVAIPVRSIIVAQIGVAPIRAFLARSFTVDAVTVQGQNAVAFVAAGDVILRGPVTARGVGATAGPGSDDAPAACAGPDHQMDFGIGTGGGGNATAGGDGGGPGTASPANRRGGALIPGFEPLVGGCRGGTISTTGLLAVGGGGGGGIQIVANGQVSLTNTALIDVGGGGGSDRAGGGSGGTIVIEAPRIVLAGPASGIVANGGAGGGCDLRGADGTASTGAAVGAKCTKSVTDPGTASAGNGGTALVLPESALNWTPCSPQLFCPLVGGGGGGSVGSAKLSTRTGDYEASGNPILSIAITRSTLTPR